MKESKRLAYISNKTSDDLKELWLNCFHGTANLNHMNAHAPYPVTQQWQLNSFLTSGTGYDAWLIKRLQEGDIIGFVVHGSFFPGVPNSIGFNIGANYTRRGYATESLYSLIDHIKDAHLTETYGHCFASNIASIRTMERCGFVSMGETGRTFNNLREVKYKLSI